MHRTLAKNAGMSLLEIGVATTILSIMILAAFQILMVSQRFQGHAVVKDSLRTQAEAALHWIIQHVENVSSEAIISTDGTSNAVPPPEAVMPFTDKTFLRFRIIKSVDVNGNRAYSDEHYSLALVLAPGELNNGVDDNGNGLVDEHVIEYKQYGTAGGGANNGASVPNTGGTLLRVVVGSVMELFDADGSGPDPAKPGLLFSCKADSDLPEERTQWKMEISVALEKVDPQGYFVNGKWSTIRSYYKTSTVVLR